MTNRGIEREINKLADEMIGAALAGNRARMDEVRREIEALRRRQARTA